MSESDLYPAIKTFLAARGYDVKGEVAGCDVVGLHASSLVIAEMKLGLTMELLLQAVDRMACADAVWLAVPATRKGRDRDARARKLCRLLGLGLLAVHRRDAIEVLAEPGPYRPRPDTRRRRRIIQEHAARQGDPSPGGTGGIPVMTAYRQEALACAALLQAGPLPTSRLRTVSPRATSIVYRNVYGWFQPVARGIYGLTAAGSAAALAARIDPA